MTPKMALRQAKANLKRKVKASTKLWTIDWSPPVNLPLPTTIREIVGEDWHYQVISITPDDIADAVRRARA